MTEAGKGKAKGLSGLLGEIHPGEGRRIVLMVLNLFLILVCYYVIKVVREPLILSNRGGAQLKSYSAALQAVVLMFFIPAYGWFSSRVDRMKLILGLNLFFLFCIEMFAFAVKLKIPYVGIAFYVWVGIFSLSVIAQFWSWANELHSEDEGKRLFPVIALGSAVGPPVGSYIASLLFGAGLPVQLILQLSAVLLLVSMALYRYVQKRHIDVHGMGQSEAKLGSAGSFRLILDSRYLLLIAGLLLVLNIVNTNGQYILDTQVKAAADKLVAGHPGFDTKAYIGTFYGNFFLITNILSVLLQAFLASRIVKYMGIAGVLLIPPIISLGAYSGIALIGGLAVTRLAKVADNASDYSIMNTARAMMWLPTSREEKYKAKQALDTFIVRSGDVMSAVLVFITSNWVLVGIRGFATINIVIAAVWMLFALLVIKQYRKLTSAQAV